MADAKDNKNKSASEPTGSEGHGHEASGHDHQDHHGSALKDSLQLGKDGDKLANLALGVGVLGIVLSVVLGGGLFGKPFQHAYLTAYMWGLAISTGAIFWLLIQHLMASRASVVVRRLGEIIAQGVGIMAVLAIPLLIPVATHNDTLYPWVNHDYMHSNHALHSKVGYLNSTFFLIRMAFYFLYFTLFAAYLLKSSVKQDAGDKDKSIAKRLQARSAPGMIVFAISLTFCAMDLLMTLDPIWFSTIFGVYYLATCVLMFQSTMVLGTNWLQKKGHLATAINQEHYHDMGKIMFGFTAFWTYVGFSQFMLIWYANIPEETHWFHDRMSGTWLNASLFLAAVHFVIPFFGMMSRAVKRNKKLLSCWAVWVMGVCWFDMYWLVAPNLHRDGVNIGLVDVTTVIGVAGVLIWFLLFRAKSVQLLATGDSRLPQSLAFENI